MAFLWRGRLYVVREVLGHWHERREWWSAAAARALRGEETLGHRPAEPQEPSFAVWSGDSSVPAAESSGGLPARIPGEVYGGAHTRTADSGPGHVGHRRGPAHRAGRGHQAVPDDPAVVVPHPRPDNTLPDGDCEVWRVEASTGRAYGNGVYDLSRTPSSGPTADSWRLLQVAD